MIGVITPPVAVAAFIVKNITREPIGVIYKGVLPFLIALSWLFCYSSFSPLSPHTCRARFSGSIAHIFRHATNMIWIMKSGRLPCQNVFMGTDQFAQRWKFGFPASATVSYSGPLMWVTRLRILTIPEYISKNMGTSQDLRKSVELG